MFAFRESLNTIIMLVHKNGDIKKIKACYLISVLPVIFKLL